MIKELKNLPKPTEFDYFDVYHYRSDDPNFLADDPRFTEKKMKDFFKQLHRRNKAKFMERYNTILNPK